jgi:hypothetical protein
MAYDTIWTSALLLNDTLASLDLGPAAFDERMQYRVMAETMSKMEFTGLTVSIGTVLFVATVIKMYHSQGPIRFNGANRQGISVLMQIQGEAAFSCLRDGVLISGERFEYPALRSTCARVIERSSP